MGVSVIEGLHESSLDDAGATYERALADGVGGGEAIAFAHARTALQAILEAERIGAGDEVVLSPLTCKVVPLALLALGIKPVYADIEAASLNLDPERADAAVTGRTRAIVFQHTYGVGHGAAEIAAVASRRGLIPGVGAVLVRCLQQVPLDAERAEHRRDRSEAETMRTARRVRDR